MTVEEKLAKLIEQIEAVAPYVIATLPYPQDHGSPVTVVKTRVKCDTPGWSAVHSDRATSSVHQLEGLAEMARRFKEEL